MVQLLIPACAKLADNTQKILDLLKQEPTLRHTDTTMVQASLRKITSTSFEVVFAGAFSAGKSMLINALLGRELLYSAEGHATGTECRIAYAESPDRERVVLTFLSEKEIKNLVEALCQELGIPGGVNLHSDDSLERLQLEAKEIIRQAGGENQSEKAKRANALQLLIKGYLANRERIQPESNSIFAMDKLNFSSLQEAANYARRGVNSSVLKKIEYYCHDPMLEDGNVIIDTPGIDAPVKEDTQITFRKIEDPDVSAVVCVLKSASAGELTAPETELLEKTKANPNIRDRVFYVFNRVDETWYNTQLRQRLERLINSDFRNLPRVYTTSGLLGFYGKLVQNTSYHDRFGLDSVFAESVKGEGGKEETPQFVYAFLNYCANSGKLPSSFRVDVRSYETGNENYVRILQEWGTPLLQQLIWDSGIEQFREAVIRYLREEKRPLLFINLADDLQPLCIALQKHCLEQYQGVTSQPQEAETMKSQELGKIGQQLQSIGLAYSKHLQEELNKAVASELNTSYEKDYRALQAAMVARLDELLANFSVADVHRRAQASHPRNSTVPVMGILVEAFYYLANELEVVLVEYSRRVVANFFDQLIDAVQKQDYYKEIYRLLGNDGGIEAELRQLQQRVEIAIENEAKTECDRYVRERPEIYTATVWQLRSVLQQSCRSFDFDSMIEAEPAIKQLLKMDFEQKVGDTIKRTYRQTINQTLNDHILKHAQEYPHQILNYYDRARSYLEQTLDKEVQEKLEANRKLQQEILAKVDTYNAAVSGINACLQALQLDRKQLPLISLDEFESTETSTGGEE
ncbi:MAG: dynamin family protein [Pseudanabaenaceae cyanobacterium SKYGB_i_bin29]|nr:dynamin family protein [Pseudanabaenaceae cyanobacterium SKYG29]MDW8420499.1 dynamin family protein [Pseudanabaenaceae cyanobacterium SKYGB_i_bin29]